MQCFLRCIEFARDRKLNTSSSSKGQSGYFVIVIFSHMCTSARNKWFMLTLMPKHVKFIIFFLKTSASDHYEYKKNLPDQLVVTSICKPWRQAGLISRMWHDISTTKFSVFFRGFWPRKVPE